MKKAKIRLPFNTPFDFLSHHYKLLIETVFKFNTFLETQFLFIISFTAQAATFTPPSKTVNYITIGAASCRIPQNTGYSKLQNLGRDFTILTAAIVIAQEEQNRKDNHIVEISYRRAKDTTDKLYKLAHQDPTKDPKEELRRAITPLQEQLHEDQKEEQLFPSIFWEKMKTQNKEITLLKNKHGLSYEDAHELYFSIMPEKEKLLTEVFSAAQNIPAFTKQLNKNARELLGDSSLTDTLEELTAQRVYDQHYINTYYKVYFPF